MDSIGASKFQERTQSSASSQITDIDNEKSRKYKCDCGALFSRRDSLVSHRMFCDASIAMTGKASTATPSLATVQQQYYHQQLPLSRRKTLVSFANLPSKSKVADPFAQAAISLQEALGAGEKLMAILQLSGSEKDLAASGIAEQLILSVKRTQTLALRKEIMFHRVLHLSDVDKPKCLVIPEVIANTFFPLTSSNKNGVLNVEDVTGKLWMFHYYLNSHQSYELSEGWSHLVEEKQLVVGDTVYFYRGVGEEANKLFIHWNRRRDVAKQSTSLALHPYHPVLQPASPDEALLSSRSNLHPTLPPFLGMTTHDALCYCALFPHNYEFEKDVIIQLWIANGYFMKEPMERFAGQFFEHCLTWGHFLFCQTDLVTGKTMYKVNRNSSSVISGCCNVLIEGNSKLNDVSAEVSHVSVKCCNLNNSTTLHDLKRFKQLKTLVFLYGHESSFKQVPRDLFLSMKLLQVLDLSHTHLVELPSSIGNMKCLRYLNLSETLIKLLPEAIDRLENLQTLKLRGCSSLSSLPKGMRRLVNLRHLDLDVRRQLRSMPPGLGTLTNIQTLSAFLVGVEEECSLLQLKSMNNLSGNFCISRLENVLTKYEAVQACLGYKSQLTKLELQWSDTRDEDVLAHEDILSSLQPNTSLEELHISCFGGFELPSWVCNPAYSKLVSVTLFKCENCLVLPSLGQLTSLKVLNISDFYKVKVIGHEFHGELISFPKLEKLAIGNMLSLEKWYGMGISDFPFLTSLTIKHCPKLSNLCTLSNLRSLENLEIIHCDKLASWSEARLPGSVGTLIIENCDLLRVELFNNESLDWLKVAHIQNVWIDSQEISFGERSQQLFGSVE